MFAEFTSTADRATRGRLALTTGASLALYGALVLAAAVAGTAASPEARKRVQVAFRPPPPPVEVAPAPPPPVAKPRPPPPRTVKTVEVQGLPPAAPLVEPQELPQERPAEAEPTGEPVAVPAAPPGGYGYGAPATTTTHGSEPVHLPENAQPPVAFESNAQPRYPEDARARGREGQVILKIVVDASGAVGRVEVLRGEEPFVSAAVAAVRSWRYRPAMLDGAPLAAFRIVKIPFRLRNG